MHGETPARLVAKIVRDEHRDVSGTVSELSVDMADASASDVSQHDHRLAEITQVPYPFAYSRCASPQSEQQRRQVAVGSTGKSDQVRRDKRPEANRKDAERSVSLGAVGIGEQLTTVRAMDRQREHVHTRVTERLYLTKYK